MKQKSKKVEQQLRIYILILRTLQKMLLLLLAHCLLFCLSFWW